MPAECLASIQRFLIVTSMKLESLRDRDTRSWHFSLRLKAFFEPG